MEAVGTANDREPSPRPSWQIAAKWSSGALFTLSLMATFLLFNLFWLTSPQNATQIIGFAVAQLSEVDLFLDANYADLIKYAKANPHESLELPEFPVELTLRCADVATMSRDQLRAHILQEASQVVYSQGWPAAKGEPNENSPFWLKGSISAANLLGRKGHRLLRILFPITAVCSALLAIVLIRFSRKFGKLMSLGVVFCVASLFSLLACFATTFAATITSSSVDDPFVLSLLELALSLLRLLQRSYVVFFCLGLALFVMGIIGSLLVRVYESRKEALLPNIE